jgi:ribosomal protein S18 acetylase RimI-like enzyme
VSLWQEENVTHGGGPGSPFDETLAISPATLDDAGAILALQKLAYESEAGLYGDWSISPLTQTLEELREEYATTLVLKATVEGQLVGSVRARVADGTCCIGRLIVHPDIQGRGIGSQLLREVEGRFPGVVKYELFTGSKSEANLRLYQRHGYVVTGTEQFSPAVSLSHLEKVARPGPAGAEPPGAAGSLDVPAG